VNRRFRSCATILILLTSIWATARAQESANTNVQILSATVRDEKIAGATLILQNNGQQSAALTTDPQGRAQLPGTGAFDPNALLIVRKPGYSDLVAKCPCGGLTYALSPVMVKLDGMRIVLNWGASPADLDGHLIYPGNHVYYSYKTGSDAALDVDHLDGFGPETVTVSRKHPGERYVYAVHDYSDKRDPDLDRLSRSGARVFVYIGQTLVRTFDVPTGKRGNIWTVFAVSPDGEFQDINTMSGSNIEAWNQTNQNLLIAPASSAQPAYSQSGVSDAPRGPIPESARKLNTRGESAYHAGDYAGAIQLFQAAIEQHGNYGQAYSNLGLVFRKTGRVAEALWADRKAIALASGPSAPTTRASTHYNNGKIYEDARQWDDALREYRAADAEKHSQTYQTAIDRMLAEGAR
jgi:hypothetical protein